MPELASKQVASASVMGVIATAVLAWLAAHEYSADAQRPDMLSARATLWQSKAEPLRYPESINLAPFSESRALRPLFDAVFGEGSGKDRASLRALQTAPGNAPSPKLRFLVAAVPDPAASLGFRFDETIDSIEAAARAHDYLLERWRLPWSEQRPRAAPELRSDRNDNMQAAAGLRAQPVPSSLPPAAGDPGLLVFRRAAAPTGQAVAATELLLVFLVFESPTQGLDRLALNRVLELAESLREPGQAAFEATRTINIIAPCYSGSLPSLRDALCDWLDSIKDTKTGKVDIEILSGTASAFDRAKFVAAISPGRFNKLGRVSFSSMMHRVEQTRDVILSFLRRSANDEDVAILSEIDTGFGESVSSRLDPDRSTPAKARTSINLQYPSQIAEIRRRYESQGLMTDETSNVFRSAADLRARGDTERQARDVFPNQVPDWTALSENRVLTQGLRYLEDSRVKVIGIIGTDPRDIIFLARLVKRYCPDARLFTIGADLVYLDSESIADLRGMIVGSTYPLYAANRSWTASGTPGQVFPSDDAQGVYNAAVVQIARMAGEPRARNETDQEQIKLLKADGAFLIEYSTPVPLRNGVATELHLPPVWVSVVGERSLYPVDCRPVELDKSRLDFEYLYHAPSSLATPGRLLINRAVGWVVFLVSASLVLLVSYSRRARHAALGPAPVRRRASLSDLALTLARVLIVAGYLYVACPALAWLVPGTVDLNLPSVWWWWVVPLALVLIPIGVTAAALIASVVEFRAGHSSWRGAEAVGTVMVVLMVSYVQVKFAAQPWWLLSLDRSAAITGGVSAYVPAAFLMAALGAWLYARRRISTINDAFAFTPEYAAPSAVALEQNWTILKEIDIHRALFDHWFSKPRDFLRVLPGQGISWKDIQPTLITIAILAGVLTDTALFRPISRSDEGVLFDAIFRLAFGLLLALIALDFARLHSAWGHFKSVLDGFAKILGGAFERIPRNVSNWLIDPDNCGAEFSQLILGKLRAARQLLTGWDRQTEPPRTRVVWNTDEALTHLANLEQHLNGEEPSSLVERGKDVALFRSIARMLSPYWADAAVGADGGSGQPVPDQERTEPGREETLIHHLEDLLALEAARWVGGALVRVWISIGFLALSLAAMLFAITSYPFPEQSRVMTVIGLAIAALVVMIFRVALGSNRNDVISRIDGTAPGRVTWDVTLVSRMAAYVVPLLGLLTALSFDMLDLFRSVLGPILRIFP